MAASNYPPSHEALNITFEEMVFCGKCKYFKRIDCSQGCVGLHCKAHLTLEYNAIHEWLSPGDCEIINCNNDCSRYEKKWYCREKRNRVPGEA